MEEKQRFYDGSAHLLQDGYESSMSDTIVMTDEMRKSIGQNPYSLDTNE